MNKDEKQIGLKYRRLAYEDALGITEKSWTKAEIKRHLELRINDVKREEESMSSKMISLNKNII